MNSSTETPLERAIRLSRGIPALIRKLNERGHVIRGRATVQQWKRNGIPAKYCPDIEDLTGVRCEQLCPDVNWPVLRRPKRARAA